MPLTASPLPDRPFLLSCVGALVGLFLLAAIATLLFRTRFTTVGGSEMSWDRAVFFSINAVTLSGFRLPINPGELKPLGQLVDYLLIASATLIYLLVGGWSLRRICDFPFSDSAIARHTAVLFTLATFFGASLLIGNGIGLAQALFDATAAFGNCGSFIGRLPEVTSFKLHGVILPLATLGGLSVPVVIDCWEAMIHQRKLTSHALNALAAAAVVYVVAVALLLLSGAIGTSASVASAGTLALNARTLGFPQSLNTAASATPWLLMLLMGIGASSGGSGGGAKSTTLWLLIREGIDLLRGRTVGRIFAVALLALVGYAALVFVTAVGLSVSQPTVAGEQLLFIAFSAVSNCGLSHQPINFGGDGLYFLSIAMLAGRFWSVAMLLLCVALRLKSTIAIG